MQDGLSFLVYPEGTRSPDGRLQRFKKGAFVMAIEAGVPIVPVACSGAHRIMKKKSLVIHPGKVTVRFGKPIDASGYTVEQRDDLARCVFTMPLRGNCRKIRNLRHSRPDETFVSPAGHES